MVNDPIFALLSIETDVPRPRVLAQGSLAACLDELKEAVLSDVVACNRARLEITATDPGGGRGATRTIFSSLTIGEGL